MPIEIDEVQAALYKVLHSSAEPLSSQLSQISGFTNERSARLQVERMIERRLRAHNSNSYSTQEVINALAVVRGILPKSSHDFQRFCVTELLKDVRHLSADTSKGSRRLKTIASELAKDLASREPKINLKKLLSPVDPRLSPPTLNSPLPPTSRSTSTTLSVPFSPIHLLPIQLLTPPTIPVPLPNEDGLNPEALSVLARKQGEKNHSQGIPDEPVPNITLFVSIESKNRKSGGFSNVLKGTYALNSKPVEVAIKYLKESNDKETSSERLSQRLRREIRSWHTFEHVNVSPFFGIVAEGENPCEIGMVSPWYSNGDIKEYLVQHPKTDRLKMLLGIADGVQYLHEKNVVHGDIKGSNIMIDDQKKPILIDFGLTQVERGPNYKSTGDTTYSVPRSLSWAAPEIIEADDICARTKASDVYALASTFLEIITGKNPYPDLNPQKIKKRVIVEKKFPDRPVKPPISDELWKILESCWKPSDPSKRPEVRRIRKKLSLLHKV